MRYFYLYIISIVSILGCSFSPKTPERILIDIGKNSFIDTLLFDRKEIIFLETRDDNLLTDNIERITLFEDKILLQDLAAHRVYVFKKDGSFLFPVGKTGRGPGEYIQLTDYCVNTHTKEIILYSNIPNKFIFYSIDEGKFLREIETEEYFHDISCTSESILGVNFYFHEPQHYISQLDFGDSLSKIRKHRMDHWDIGGIFVGGKQITRSKKINFSRRYDNTIYSFQNNRIIPRFHADFGERNLPEHIGKLKISTEEFRKISDNKVFSIVNLKETPDCMYFSTLYPGLCFFGKKRCRADIITEWQRKIGEL